MVNIKKVQFLLAELGTQRKVASKLGVNQSTISRILKGLIKSGSKKLNSKINRVYGQRTKENNYFQFVSKVEMKNGKIEIIPTEMFDASFIEEERKRHFEKVIYKYEVKSIIWTRIKRRYIAS